MPVGPQRERAVQNQLAFPTMVNAKDRAVTNEALADPAMRGAMMRFLAGLGGPAVEQSIKPGGFGPSIGPPSSTSGKLIAQQQTGLPYNDPLQPPSQNPNFNFPPEFPPEPPPTISNLPNPVQNPGIPGVSAEGLTRRLSGTAASNMPSSGANAAPGSFGDLLAGPNKHERGGILPAIMKLAGLYGAAAHSRGTFQPGMPTANMPRYSAIGGIRPDAIYSANELTANTPRELMSGGMGSAIEPAPIYTGGMGPIPQGPAPTPMPMDIMTQSSENGLMNWLRGDTMYDTVPNAAREFSDIFGGVGAEANPGFFEMLANLLKRAPVAP